MTTTAVPPTTGASAPISLRIDTTKIARALEVAPSATYYWLRSYLRGSFIGHRNVWLAGKGTQFGRGGANSRAIRVFRLDEAPPGTPQDNWVVYEVNPREKRLTDPTAARLGLARLEASVHAGSIVLKVHQEGTDIHSSGWMALPVRTRPGSPKAWRAKNPGKELILRPSKNPNTLLLFERTRVRGRGRPRKDGTSNAKVTERLRLRFLLRKDVDMKPTLQFYESWDRGAAERDRQFAYVADRILKDVANGVFA